MAHTVSKIISDDTLSRIIQVESAGKVRAKAPTSSASGLGQFIDDTWMQMIRTHRPDLLRGRSRQDVLDLRFDPFIMIEMLARFTEGNAKALGPGYTDGDLYLAHFAGVGTARRLLGAHQDTPATSIFTPQAARANPSIIPGRTVGQVRAWANTKMAKAGGRDWIATHYRSEARQAFADADVMPEDVPVEDEVRGDPDVYAVQQALDEMNYKPGGLDGRWGGMTAAAIAAFLNDRPGDVGIEAPTSAKHFAQSFYLLWREIEYAQADGWTRPLAEARKTADLSKVAQTAPEVVPVQKGFLAIVWGMILACFTAVADMAKWAWSFFSENRDVVDPGMMSKAFSYLGYVPSWVWILAVAGGLAFIAFNYIRPGRDGIIQSVQSGERP